MMPSNIPMFSSVHPSSSVVARVPPEIQTHIVDALRSCSGSVLPDDLAALRACLNVSSVFRWSARRHLFRVVLLAGENERRIHSTLQHLRTLIDLPDLGVLPFIRVLDMDMSSLCSAAYDDNGHHHHTPDIHTAIREAIQFMFDMFCRSKARLDTVNFRGPEDCPTRSFILGDLRSFQNVIQSRHLRSLGLCHVPGLPKDILYGTSVTNLTIIDSAIADDSTDIPSNLSLPCLETIETDDLSLVRSLYPVDHLSVDEGMSSICLRLDKTDAILPQMLDKECAVLREHFPSVENLHIVLDSDDLAQILLSPPNVCLSQLKALKYLTLHYGDMRHQMSTPLPIGFYISHISSILQACPESIRYLTVILEQMTPSREVIAADPAPWAKLDSLLNVDTFPYLEGIDIRARSQSPTDLTHEAQIAAQHEAEKCIEVVLPSPTALGMMTIMMHFY